jgi:hypothetical protein
VSIEQLTQDWLWDAQVLRDGLWLSFNETPFESYIDAEEEIDVAVKFSTKATAFRIIPVLP